jgi:hypothetical protein
VQFEANAKLARLPVGDQSIRFDGAHTIDVLCHGGDRGLAIEAKLGLDRMSRAQFTSRFLGVPRRSGHKDPRFSGSMAGILAHRATVDGIELALRTEHPNVSIVPDWFLVIRRQVWTQWNSTPPDLVTAHVALFEDVVRMYGAGQEFNDLVQRVVGNGFYEAWGLTA